MFSEDTFIATMSRSPGSPAPLPSLPSTPRSAAPFSSLPEIDTRADRVNLEARVSYPGLELSGVYTTWKERERARDRVSCWTRFGVLIILAVGIVITAIVCAIVAGVLLKPGPSSAAATNSESDRGHDSGPNRSGTAISVETLVTSVSGHLTTIQITRTGSFTGNIRPTDVSVPASPSHMISQTSTKTSSSSPDKVTTVLISRPTRSSRSSKSTTLSFNTNSTKGPSPLITSTVPVPGVSTTRQPPVADPPVMSETGTNMESPSPGLGPQPTTDPKATPKFSVWFGDAEGSNFKRKIAFVETGAPDSACQYTTISELDINPCGIPVLLADGLEYVWNGCGGPSWVDWRNPASTVAKFQTLSTSCLFAPQTWKCGDSTIKLGFRCGF